MYFYFLLFLHIKAYKVHTKTYFYVGRIWMYIMTSCSKVLRNKYKRILLPNYKDFSCHLNMKILKFFRCFENYASTSYTGWHRKKAIQVWNVNNFWCSYDTNAKITSLEKCCYQDFKKVRLRILVKCIPRF